ncbi:MAG: hypothetical protein BGP16_11445 [Sphingobium sp. 66-54]|nr:MAG: hypothetical protein BGP16_11445 [Sphingobium sp. 66-54]
MYESDDPRSRLATARAAPAPAATAFGSSTYARFYATPPQSEDALHRTWFARGQNFIVVYTEAQAGAVFERTGQVDEYVLLLPEADSAVTVEANGERQEIGGFTVTMIPPGNSVVRVTAGGPVVRLFSVRSEDLAALASNAATYAGPHPQVPPFQPWPDPVGGFRIRSYSLDVPDQPGRFGKIFRCTTFMVNVFPPQMGPRDPAKLSPHHHDDFEQCSLAIGGTYVHHLRWPWTANLADWREDEHETCGSPSIAVIPPRVIHTSAAIDPGANLLVDIFSPPREDFSKMEGWVLNAADYPMPA